MNTMYINARILLLLVFGLGGCDFGSARNEFNRQIEVCSAGERNGVLNAAVQSCGAALAIAEEHGYAPELISGLLFRLGRLERQRGRFQEAEVLVSRSLALEDQAGKTEMVASRLVELALSMAGQRRWGDGAELLERASPSVGNLSRRDREAAANAFKVFSRRLSAMGHTARAKQFEAKAKELSGS